jgi:hypothetical protein
VWEDDTVGNGLLVSIPGVVETGRKAILVAHLDTVYDVGRCRAASNAYGGRQIDRSRHR